MSTHDKHASALRSESEARMVLCEAIPFETSAMLRAVDDAQAISDDAAYKCMLTGECPYRAPLPLFV